MIDNELMWDTFRAINPEVESDYEMYISQPQKIMGRVVPRGFKEEDGSAVPIPAVLAILIESMYHNRYSKSLSLRQILLKITPIFEAHGQKVPAVNGLSKIFNRLEKELGLRKTQEEYVSQRQKLALELRAKTGKSPDTKDLRKEYHKIEFKKKQQQLEDLRKQERTLKASVFNSGVKAGVKGKEILDVARKTTPKQDSGIVIPNLQVEAYMKALQEEGMYDTQTIMNLYLAAVDENSGSKRKVAFLPTPKQYEFMASSEDIVLYGGAAGGGKSFSLLFDAVRYAHMKGYRGVLIRRTMPELRELIDISRELYPQIFRGAKYSTQEKTWRFPSGAVLEFGFLDAPSDKYQYQGKQYAWIGFDELGLQDTPEGFDYLKSRLRTTLPIKPAIRCTANPGSLWVKERFIDPAPANVTFRDRAGLTYRFIPSLVSDNPYIYQNGDGQYVKMLNSMSEVERKQLLEGDWTVSDDSAFPEFKVETHVRPESEYYPPAHWNRFCGIDYGFHDQSAAIWGAVDPSNGQIVIYREWAQSGLDGFKVARAILGEESNELMIIDRVVDHTIWNVTGQTGPTIGQEMQRGGLRMRKADKNREGGKVQIHAMLSLDEISEEPGMIILDSCPRLIRELQSLRKADKKAGASVEDIKQTRLNGNHNDLYDALRYALMSRPRRQTVRDAMLDNKSSAAWGRINSMFS